MIKMKIPKMGNSLQMTRSVDVARFLDIKDGDCVEVGVTNNHMIVKKA